MAPDSGSIVPSSSSKTGTLPSGLTFLNAWCELRSPLQQISESQPRTTKLLVEPDTEIVQRYPRRQASSQAFQLMGPLPPEVEGIEELVVDRLGDLAYPATHLLRRLGQFRLREVRLGG